TPPPHRPTLFPYTTLFRSGFVRAKGGPGQEQRVHAEAEQGHSSRLHEDTSRDGHRSLLRPIVFETPVPRSRARPPGRAPAPGPRSEEHTSELQSRENLVCR